MSIGGLTGISPNNAVLYNQYLNPLSRPLLTAGQFGQQGIQPGIGMLPTRPVVPGQNIQAGLGQTNPMMLMMMSSMQQMMNYIRQLESSVNGGNTTTPEPEAPQPAQPVEGATAFTGTHTIDSLAEKHTIDMSGLGEQTLVIDGKHNVVTADTTEGADGVDHYKVGSENEVMITKFGLGDTLELEGKASDYTIAVADGALLLKNKEEGIEIAMGIDPALIGEENTETMKNILSQISAEDRNLWEHHQLVNFNADAERTVSEHTVGDKKSHKAGKGNTADFGENKEYQTYNIQDVKKKGIGSKRREDNVYVLQGNQNEFNITGDHGANRFMIGATASNINIEHFGGDDSLQFADPSAVDITEGENGEVILYDYSTSSTVTIQNGNIDDIKDGIGVFDGQDDLAEKIKKQAKNDKLAKLGASAALTVGSMFVGSGGYGGAIGKVLGVGTKVGGLISTGAGWALQRTTGVGYIDLGSMLKDKNPFLSKSKSTLDLSKLETNIPNNFEIDNTTLTTDEQIWLDQGPALGFGS